MKLKYLALSTALMMALALTGCSASRDNNSAAPVNPTNSAALDDNSRASASSEYGAENSAGLDDGAYSSDAVGSGNGGGRTGDNYGQNNVSGTSRSRSSGTDVIDDIGNAAGDLARSAGNVVRDAGNAIGNAANNAGSAVP